MFCGSGKIKIPDGVLTIGMDTFSGCAGLTSVALPESLESIESNAFYGCAKLSGIVFPKGLKRIGDRAFAGCKALKDLVLPDGLAEAYGVIVDWQGCSGDYQAYYRYLNDKLRETL